MTDDELDRTSNVILLPKTIEYYQIELTSMLENEQYNKAIALLQFLLRCETNHPSLQHEWEALLNWLEITFVLEDDEAISEEAELSSENELLRKNIRDKKEHDETYIHKLMELLYDPSMEKQLMALEQLTYVDLTENLKQQLKDWLETTTLHPFVQFKTLQVLKIQQMTGTIRYSNHSQIVQVAIESTPIDPEQYPQPINNVLRRVQSISENEDPNITYFSEQTWGQYIAFIYGTNTYEEISCLDADEESLWAASLHQVMLEITMGETEFQERLLGLYDIDFVWRDSWKLTCEKIRRFFADAL